MFIRNGNKHMKDISKIKFEFKGLIMEMLSNEIILNKFLNIIGAGVWLFGLAALIHAIAAVMAIFIGK